jgi:hypothetical protein
MHRPAVAFGPVMPGWGSWDWVGADLAAELGKYFRVLTFPPWEVPACDALVLVKHAPPPLLWERLARRCSLLYCPVDSYGAAEEIRADGELLGACSRVLIHCERLRPHFEPYCRVEYVDHHVKFASPLREEYKAEGFILWVGVRSNLPALARWVNSFPPPAELVVLTNPEDPARVPAPWELGFRPGLKVRVEPWSAALHLERVREARAALDVKGGDFRSRHKPPAKAIDFIASGLPLAMNPGSSPVEHLAGLGLTVASPLDPDRWLSRPYWEETRELGRRLRRKLSLEQVALHYRRFIDDALGG